MPKSHRDFLESLENGVSVRAYCLCEWRKASVEGAPVEDEVSKHVLPQVIKQVG